jgi:hypothetical protein
MFTIGGGVSQAKFRFQGLRSKSHIGVKVKIKSMKMCKGTIKSSFSVKP